MWWDEVRSLDDIHKLVQFEQLVQPEKDCLTMEEYISWMGMGLEISVLKETRDVWKGSYQTINNADGGIIFAGFGRNPIYKGKGIGQILMNRLLTRSKSASFICETRHDNTPMLALLKENGFVFMHDEHKDDDHWTWWIKQGVSNARSNSR